MTHMTCSSEGPESNSRTCFAWDRAVNGRSRVVSVRHIIA